MAYTIADVIMDAKQDGVISDAEASLMFDFIDWMNDRIEKAYEEYNEELNR